MGIQTSINMQTAAALSERCMAVLEIARSEAERLENSHISVEHLLLGLVMLEVNQKRLQRVRRHRQLSMVGQIFKDKNITNRRIEGIIQRQNVGFVKRYPDSPQLDFSNEAKYALQLASDEVHWMDQKELDVGHLLVGIFLEPKGAIVAQTMKTNPREICHYLREQLLTKRSGLLWQRNRKKSRYTAAAQVALSHAQQAAKELAHEYIGTEHLLIGLASEHTGVAGRILKNLGIQHNHVQARVIETIPKATDTEVLLLSRPYKRLLDRSGDEIRARNHILIGTGHLLYHLVQSDESCIRILRRLGVTREDMRKRFKHYMQPQANLLEGVAWQPFERIVHFSTPVLYAFEKARQEAERLQHRTINTGHLLMGLMLETESLTAAILREHGIDRRRVRGLIELMTTPEFPYRLNPMQLSDDVQAILNNALDSFNHDIEYPMLDTPPLLLSLLEQDTDTVAIKILNQLEIDHQKIAQAVQSKLPRRRY